MKHHDTITIDVETRRAFVVIRHDKFDGIAVVTVEHGKYNCHIAGIDYPIRADHLGDAAWKARTELVARARVANMKVTS